MLDLFTVRTTSIRLSWLGLKFYRDQHRPESGGICRQKAEARSAGYICHLIADVILPQIAELRLGSSFSLEGDQANRQA